MDSNNIPLTVTPTADGYRYTYADGDMRNARIRWVVNTGIFTETHFPNEYSARRWCKRRRNVNGVHRTLVNGPIDKKWY